MVIRSRIHALHNLLSPARVPVSRIIIEEELECSTSTVERIIADMRTNYSAPIEYDREHNGYYYDQVHGEQFELPGLWFSASELYGLFASYKLLSEVGLGLLEKHIAPIKQKLEALITNGSVPKNEVHKRIRLLQMSARIPSPKHFESIASAVLMRKKL